MGYETDLHTILSAVQTRRAEFARNSRAQSWPARLRIWLVSATLDIGVTRLASKTLEHPHTVDLNGAVLLPPASDRMSLPTVERSPTRGVGTTTLTPGTVLPSGSTFCLPPQLRQYWVRVDLRYRHLALVSFLRRTVLESRTKGSFSTPGTAKLIVFFAASAQVDFFFELFSGELPARPHRATDLPVSILPTQLFKLHGNLPQPARVATLHSFLAATEAVLLCTDVAARGLDVPAVDWIVQFDPATTLAEYVHRIGRTGRIGKPGQSLIFLLPHECGPYLGVFDEGGIPAPSPLDFTRDVLAGLPALDIPTFLARPHQRGSASTSRHPSLPPPPPGARSGSGRVSSPPTSSTHRPRLPHRFSDAPLFPERVPGDRRHPTDCTGIVQARIETWVNSDPARVVLAIRAHLATVRAYATRPKRDALVFWSPPRLLHLGHLARSYGLTDPPTRFSQILREYTRGVRTSIRSRQQAISQSVSIRAVQTHQRASEFSHAVDL